MECIDATETNAVFGNNCINFDLSLEQFEVDHCALKTIPSLYLSCIVEGLGERYFKEQ